MSVEGQFTWCDLSTFDLSKAKAFYREVFGWTPQTARGSGVGEDYTLMFAAADAAAALYTMPEFFQSIRMPSFWMSYVRVASVEASFTRANELGARCEIEPTVFDADSRFALVRDPAGAGFTLYEGPDLEGRVGRGQHGRLVWNELHVRSIDEVESFYRDLFGWELESSNGWRRKLRTHSGQAVASIAEIDEATKGPNNYWAVVFSVGELERTLRMVTARGGQILSPHDAGLGFVMACDDQQGVFCVADEPLAETLSGRQSGSASP